MYRLDPQRLDAVCQAIQGRTATCLARASTEQRYSALERRWRDVGAMLELARPLDDYRLVRFLERHKDALRRIIDEEC
jgi:hypothetical protein